MASVLLYEVTEIGGCLRALRYANVETPAGLLGHECEQSYLISEAKV
jgi:hypothetical protein